MADFQVQFQRLAAYARYIAGNEEDKIMKFKWALKFFLWNHIISNRYSTMDSLIDNAREVEIRNFIRLIMLSKKRSKIRKENERMTRPRENRIRRGMINLLLYSLCFEI